MSYEQIRKIQLQQLKMLKEIIPILEANGIQYFAIGGTALGAIRNNGFIPWDDDIDLAFLRPDYEKLFEIREKLPSHMFLWNHKIDKGFPLLFSKIFDSREYFKTNGERKYKVPNYIFIDCFPWDKIIDSDAHSKKLGQIKKKFRRSVYKTNGSLVEKIKYYIYKLAYGFKTSKDFMGEYENTIKEFSKESKGEWGRLLNNDLIDYDDIFPLRKIKFEDIEINIPKNCEKYLKRKYGNYMEIPAEAERYNHLIK